MTYPLTVAGLRRELSAELEGLLALDTQSLLDGRYGRFRRIGQEAEAWT